MKEKIKRNLKNIYRDIQYLLAKKDKAFNLVFLIGCGRSGTTILGRTLSKHDSITFLNERRDLWHMAFPELDIWSGKIGTPKLLANANDVTPEKSKKLRSLFYREQIADNGDVLLEKLPINNFRLELIKSVFPEAKFIYIHRNGLEVAASIEKLINKSGWLGKNELKWKLLNELVNNTPNIPKKEFSNFEKGLLEWRFSVDLSEEFFSNLDKSCFYSLSYESFLENPYLQIKSIYDFMDLSYTYDFIIELVKDIKRKSTVLKEINESLKFIGGEKLEWSVRNKLRQTVPNN